MAGAEVTVEPIVRFRDAQEALVDVGLHFLELGLALFGRLTKPGAHLDEKAFGLAEPDFPGGDILVELGPQLLPVLGDVLPESLGLGASPVLLFGVSAHGDFIKCR